MDNRFLNQKFLVRRKIFTLLGAKYHIYDPAGQLILFSKRKGFKLKEDIRLYTGEDMTQELICIQARKMIDFSATYDVFDSQSGLKIGALRRRGLKSMLQDEWVILNAVDQEFGMIKEDSMGLALLRRFLVSLVPQSFNVTVNGVLVSTLKQNFNPFVLKLNVDLTYDVNRVLDPRLGVAAAVLITSIEGQQS